MVKRPIHDLRFFAAARLEGDPSASTSRSEGGKRDAFVNAVEEWSTRGLVEKESLAVKDVVGGAVAVSVSSSSSLSIAVTALFVGRGGKGEMASKAP